jgi:hypothetical protein
MDESKPNFLCNCTLHQLFMDSVFYSLLCSVNRGSPAILSPRPFPAQTTFNRHFVDVVARFLLRNLIDAFYQLIF